jgi:hypothetical protein
MTYNFFFFSACFLCKVGYLRLIPAAGIEGWWTVVWGKRTSREGNDPTSMLNSYSDGKENKKEN